MKKFVSLTTILMLATLLSWAQNTDYIYPLEGVAGLYSANFGELRANHFHSGIDIKTDGVEGKRVVATADGYVSRISLSPYGYGLALYVTHPNGTTSVYGHLSRFRDDISAYVERERYRTKSHSVNLFPSHSKFVVSQGDMIALSGNSGSSSGPHLHFEIRETSMHKPINLVAEKIIDTRDNIAPLILKLHYIEIDSLQGVAHNAPRRSFDVVKSGSQYVIAGGGDVSVGRKGYFVVEVSDRKNGVSNTFGVYGLRAKVDSTTIVDYSMDGFLFANTRYCNAVGYYPIMVDSRNRNEPLRLALLENGDSSHYRTIIDRGVVTSQVGQRRKVSIEVEDDSGNISTFNFSVVGKRDEDCFRADSVDREVIVVANKPYTYSGDGVTVSIPANALYESILFSCRNLGASTADSMSATYQIMDAQTPLHKAMTISMAASVPQALQSKVGLMYEGTSSRPTFIKGEYKLGSVAAQSSAAGKFYVGVDTLPPTLTLRIAEGSQQRGSNYFTCKIADDLSGIATYNATLNGEWIALNLDKGVLRHNFVGQPTDEQHTLIITATDMVGNTTTITRQFFR